MGFYVRKSVKAGPFRFNLSKSGVGVSAGIPGFRVGTGPRGNYIHAGRGGVYYRTTFGGGGRRQAVRPARGPYPAPNFSPSDGIVMTDVTGASAEELHATGPGDLVEQLNTAARMWRLGWMSAGLVLLLLVARPSVGAFLLIPGIPITVWLWLRDRARRAVVAFYDVNDEVATWFESLVTAFEALAACNRLWRVNAAGRVETTYQYKVNSGASKVVDRAVARLSLDPPTLLKTNITVPTISVGKTALAFLPDRILARSGKTYSDATYAELNATGYAQRFIESDSRPRDSRQVDTTWQYVNVKGGPDRRFKNNRQLPVMLYGQLEIATQNGLFWVLQTSRPEPADLVAQQLLGAPTTLQRVQDAAPSTAQALPAPAT